MRGPYPTAKLGTRSESARSISVTFFLVRAPGNNSVTNDGVVRPQMCVKKIIKSLFAFIDARDCRIYNACFAYVPDDLPLQNRERLFAADPHRKRFVIWPFEPPKGLPRRFCSIQSSRSPLVPLELSKTHKTGCRVDCVWFVLNFRIDRFVFHRRNRVNRTFVYFQRHTVRV